jgi:iron complex outermembrane receptor protein
MAGLIDGSSRLFKTHGYRRCLQYGVSLAALFLYSPIANAQQSTVTNIPGISVDASGATTTTGGYATAANYQTPVASMGPLGNTPILETPASVTIVPQDLMVNMQMQTVNDTLSYLPSVEIRDQQGFEISRPQSRGFQSTIAQNTRLDGLNIIGTTVIATDNLSGIEVLNGFGGALYGPETPAGVFNYMLAQPTAKPLVRVIESFQSDSTFTEQGDFAGTTADGKVGYRLNVVQGNGASFAPQSNVDRTLGSVLFDFHLNDSTTLETYYSHYATDITGLPGSIVYDSGKSTVLPKATNPTEMGLGQPGAGADLISDTGLVKLIHVINQDWSFEIGGLYENAIRNLWGITNTMTNNSGDYTVTKNFNAIPHYTIGSNEAALNGHVLLLGFENDVSLGTNGFINGQHSNRNSISQTLGTSNLADPEVFSSESVPNTGGQYKSGSLFEQSIITADTLHLNDQWAV